MLTDFQRLADKARESSARSVRGRYAPSPSGPQHHGNLRTALLAWLQVRLMHGTFVLRMEDLDQPRVVPGSAQQILDELRWLGLDWDEGPDSDGPFAPYVQSQRSHYYRHAFDRLLQQDLVYPCFCSRKDIQTAASAPHGAQGPIYPGTCRRLGQGDVPGLIEQTGRQPAWRVRTDDMKIDFDDQLLGPQQQHLATEVGDFVVLRRDGLFAYQLAVVVDDALMGITDVLRGADLAGSTPRQIMLYRALDLPTPRFWHVPLMADAQGRRLAKRDGLAVSTARHGSMDPNRLVSELLGSVGLPVPDAGDPLRSTVATSTVEGFVHKLRSSATAA